MAKPESALHLCFCRNACLKVPGLLALFVFVLLPTPAAGGASQKPLNRYEFSLPRMGTIFRIILYAQNQVTASKAATAAFERVEQLEQIFSDYREGSELSRLCRTAGRAPQPVSNELYSILEESLRISELSGGAFDVSIGPLAVLWREARLDKRLPDAALLAKARLAVGFQNIVLDPEEHTVFLKRDDMRLDLGAIAPGFSGDAVLEVLRFHGIRSALVDTGGELSLGNPPPGLPGWRVEIQDGGAGFARQVGTLTLHNVTIATSGDALQFLEAGGQHFSHVIDPVEGLGVRNCVSTTVIAPGGATADGLSTALSVLPVSEGLKLVDSLEAISAFLVRRTTKGLQLHASSRFPVRVAETQLQANQGTFSHH